MQKAAEYCADVITSGWEDVVAGRAAGYVSDEVWHQLLRGRRKRYCKALAQAADDLLSGSQKIHTFLGFLAARGIRLWGGSDAVQAFVQQLVSAIPLPTDAKFLAAARGLQVTGVLLCVMSGRDLTRCECFIDLALNETKTQVKKILMTAMGDWVGLRAFPSRQRDARR